MDHLCFCVLCFSNFESVHCSRVVNCWERADLLAIVGDGFFVLLLLFHVVSWVSCGYWLYRFLIFASFLTLGYAFPAIWLI